MQISRLVSTTGLALVTSLLFQVAPLKAQGLFVALPDAAPRAGTLAAADPTVVRSRRVQIDWARLRASAAPSLPLNLFDDAAFTAVIDRSSPAPQASIWQGHVAGEKDSEVTLVAVDGVLVGNVRAGGRSFQIRYEADGSHTVREIDESRFPPDGEPIPVDVPRDEAAADASGADSGATFDVMAMYTSTARANAGGTAAMLALVNLAVAESNTAYQRSGVVPRMRLVYTAEVAGYTENGAFSTELSRLQNPSDGFMDNIHALRNAFGADIVSLIIEGDGSLCGQGFIMTTLSTGFAPNAFSVSARNCTTGNYTFSHEMGHNMGLRHDRIADPSAAMFPYGHGYVDATNGFRDIMGVATGCGGCPRIQNFSNPNVNFNGFPTGVSQAASNSADGAAAISNAVATFANWRTQVAVADWGGDGKSDIAVFRGGAWLFHDFATGAQNSGVWTGATPGCVPVGLDYDGNGRTDFSLYCSGAWHFYNADGTYNKGIWTGGLPGDLPMPADYDGDGKDDVVVYRGGAWLFYDFATGAFNSARSVWTGGQPGCIPAPMDYNGDFKADFTQLCSGAWHFYNADGTYNKGIWTGGVPGDLPVPADYDGDGKDDFVIYRGGAWLFYDFATGAFNSARSIWTGAPAHLTGGIPLPAPLDYDGDGKVDFTVYSGGPWHFFNADGSYNKGIWTGGVPGDQPISRRPLP